MTPLADEIGKWRNGQRAVHNPAAWTMAGLRINAWQKKEFFLFIFLEDDDDVYYSNKNR